MITVTMHLPKDLKDRIKITAEKNNRPFSVEVRSTLSGFYGGNFENTIFLNGTGSLNPCSL